MIDKKQITKVCNNCSKCGLPSITCICNDIKEVRTKSKFIILSSEREIDRNTNTANLLKLVNPESTEIIIWKRRELSKERIIITILQSPWMIHIYQLLNIAWMERVFFLSSTGIMGRLLKLSRLLTAFSWLKLRGSEIQFMLQRFLTAVSVYML